MLTYVTIGIMTAFLLTLTNVNIVQAVMREDSYNLLLDLDWSPAYNAVIEGNDPALHIFSNTTERVTIYEDEEFVYDRAYAPINWNLTGTISPAIALRYSSDSDGDALIVMEIRGSNNSVLWSADLGDTNGKLVDRRFALPDRLVASPGELRFYLITGSPSSSSISLHSAHLIIPSHFPIPALPWLYQSLT